MSDFGTNCVPHYCYGDTVYVSAEWYVAKSPIGIEHFDGALYYFTGCRYMEFVDFESGARSGVKYEWDEQIRMYKIEETEG